MFARIIPRMAKPKKPTTPAPAWWLLYGVLCGLAGAGLLAFLLSPPRGTPVALEPAPIYQVALIPVTAATRTPAATPEPLLVNINTAGSADLQKLPNIGPATAQAILAYRERHGPFATLEDLQQVPGIGPKTYEGLLGMITLGDE